MYRLSNNFIIEIHKMCLHSYIFCGMHITPITFSRLGHSNTRSDSVVDDVFDLDPFSDGEGDAQLDLEEDDELPNYLTRTGGKGNRHPSGGRVDSTYMCQCLCYPLLLEKTREHATLSRLYHFQCIAAVWYSPFATSPV